MHHIESTLSSLVFFFDPLALTFNIFYFTASYVIQHMTIIEKKQNRNDKNKVYNMSRVMYYSEVCGFDFGKLYVYVCIYIYIYIYIYI